MLKNKTLHTLAATRFTVTGKPVDLALFAALDKELQKPDLQPTDAELVELSDMLDLTYGGGKNPYQEEGDISELVALFARAVLCKYGQHRTRQPVSEADLAVLQQALEALENIATALRNEDVLGRDIELLLDAGTNLRTVLAQVPPADAGRLETPVRPAIGDYVLATKWDDGDPGDPWALGFYAGELDMGNDREQIKVAPRYLVNNSAGQSIRPNGYRRVARIRKDVGAWLLNVAAKQLEASPPGTVNLWTMLKPAAFDVSNEQA